MTVFADWSNYQSPDVAAYRAAYDVVAEQGSWGNAATIPAGRCSAIRAADFELVIWYMGLRADQDIAGQVSAFVGSIGGVLLPNEALMIDWEWTPGAGTPSSAQVGQCRSLLCTHFGIGPGRVLLYGSGSTLSSAPPGSPLWDAAYGGTEPGYPHALWQFTDGQGASAPNPPYGPVNFPGIGFCDASVYHGTSAQLRALLIPSPKEDLVAITKAVSAFGQDHILQLTGGELEHYWVDGAGKHGPENLNAHLPGIPKVAQAADPVLNAGGQLVVTCEDASGAGWYLAQAQGKGWGVLAL